MDIRKYTPELHEELLKLTLRAWSPVFDKTQHDVPEFVYRNFYPQGWAARQKADVSDYLQAEGAQCHVAWVNDAPAGFIGLKVHHEDNMGEVVIIAVAPRIQGQGLGRALMRVGEAEFARLGRGMVMVETVGDSGHAPARRLYESSGFERWPVARYFKPL